MSVRILDSLNDLDKAQWVAIENDHFPFTDYDFLLALEESNSVGVDSGWVPRFKVVEKEGSLLAALIEYEKRNSYGEYIFDWEWAHAYQAHGLDYYPKLLSAVPFTPATGSKFLGKSSKGEDAFKAYLGDCLSEEHCSSSHHLFIPPLEQARFNQQGYIIRKTFQFHWENNDYESFDHFLSFFIGKKRKNIIKERREVSEELSFQRLTGCDIKPEDASFMYSLYMNTIYKKYSQAYLTREFFDQVFQTMKDRMLLTLALDHKSGKRVGASLCFYKGNKVYGRYWGAIQEYKHMHFELCYYQPLEFAIEKKMKVFEAGAQGGHKWQRGFLPVPIYSAHKMGDPSFHAAISKWVEKEKQFISRDLAAAEKNSPFRQAQR